MHHLFVNWDDSDHAKDMLAHLMRREPKDANLLTTYGETALDLSIEHKTSAIKFVLEHYRDKFDFTLCANPHKFSLLHRSVLCMNYSALMSLLAAQVCDLQHRSVQGRLASSYAQQYIFLNKVLLQAESK